MQAAASVWEKAVNPELRDMKKTLHMNGTSVQAKANERQNLHQSFERILAIRLIGRATDRALRHNAKSQGDSHKALW
jgi:hypothetical protein